MKSKLPWLLLAVIIAFGLVWCSAKKPGVKTAEVVTDTEIHIAQWGPQTGRAAAWGAIARATGDYFKMINDEGGIHGRKIFYHIVDDAYNPARTRAGVKQLQEGIGIFAWIGGIGTANALAVMDYLMEKKVPWIVPASGFPLLTNPPKKYLFAICPLFDMQAKVLCRYAVNNLGKKRIAIIYQNDDYGKLGLKGAAEELAKHGMKLVAEIPSEVTDIDMKPHVMRLRKAKADAVLLYVAPDQAIHILGAAKAMQYATQWMGSYSLADFPLMYNISKGLWKGMIASTFGELPYSGHPLMRKYRKAFDKYAAKGERWGPFYYFAFLGAELMVEGLKRSGRDLTRERFVKELEGLKNFQGIGPKVTFKPFDPNDPSCRQGANTVFLVECLADGRYKKLTDWMQTD